MIPPVTLPGGKPVTAVPGLTPKSPVMTVGPVLVTVEAPKNRKGLRRPQWRRRLRPAHFTDTKHTNTQQKRLHISSAFSVIALTVRKGGVESDPETKLADANNGCEWYLSFLGHVRNKLAHAWVSVRRRLAREIQDHCSK